MSLATNILYAAHANGTHHKLALGALKRLNVENAADWERYFYKYIEAYLEGSKAPDKKFKDFKNHVLHVKDDFWGGAPQKVEEWYGKTVESLKAENWEEAAFNAGVLSHYYTDPCQPMHTGQSDGESMIHRAAEWSISKSYEELEKIANRDWEQLSINLPADGPNWPADLVKEGATFANEYYEHLIVHYNFDKGVVKPKEGYNSPGKQVLAKLIAYARQGNAILLSKAIKEAAVAPPQVNLTVGSVLSGLSIPLRWVTRKMADSAEAKLVAAMYDELQQTGNVDKTLPEDDRFIRDSYAREVRGRDVAAPKAQEDHTPYVPRKDRRNSKRAQAKEARAREKEELAAARLAEKQEKIAEKQAIKEDRAARKQAAQNTKIQRTDQAAVAGLATQHALASQLAPTAEPQNTPPKDEPISVVDEALEPGSKSSLAEQLSQFTGTKPSEDAADQPQLEAEPHFDKTTENEPVEPLVEKNSAVVRDDMVEEAVDENTDGQERPTILQSLMGAPIKDPIKTDAALSQNERYESADEQISEAVDPVSSQVAGLASSLEDMKKSEEIAEENAARELTATVYGVGRDDKPRKMYLQLSDDVEAAPSIGSKTAHRLYSIGIHTVEDLLGANPQASSIALNTGYITEEVFLGWQDQATLQTQIPGLRGHDVQFLVGAGYFTKDDVAHADSEALLEDVETFLTSPDGERALRGGKAPDMDEILEWIDSANYKGATIAA